MMQRRVFRSLYWFSASFFFFAASVLIISYLRLGPSEIQVQAYMSGMMSAMHNSLMGVTMDAGEIYSFMLNKSAQLSLLMILVGIFVGSALRVWRRYDKG